MAFLRRSSLPGLCLSLLLGVALAWPELAHRRLHEEVGHGHHHSDADAALTEEQRSIGSAQHETDHPHLDLTAATPTKSGLYLLFLVSAPARLDVPMTAPVVTMGLRPSPGGPRSPPSIPQQQIRAPPTV
jgi:hypothetical protein